MTTSELANLTNNGVGDNNREGNRNNGPNNQGGQGRGDQNSPRNVGSRSGSNHPLTTFSGGADAGAGAGGVKEDLLRMADHNV